MSRSTLRITLPILLTFGVTLNASLSNASTSLCPSLQTSAERYSFASLALLRGGLGLPSYDGQSGTTDAGTWGDKMCAALISSTVQATNPRQNIVTVHFVFQAESCQQVLQLASDGRVVRDVTPVQCQTR